LKLLGVHVGRINSGIEISEEGGAHNAEFVLEYRGGGRKLTKTGGRGGGVPGVWVSNCGEGCHN